MINGYFPRWGGWDGMFNNKVNDAKKYLNDIRNAMVNIYLPNYFSSIGISSGNLRDVSIAASGGVSGATIKVNSITIKNASAGWTGKYYSGNPITVTASPAPSGYEFDGWTVTNGSAVSPTALTTTVNITGNAQITARYRQQGISVIEPTGISLNTSALNLASGGTSTLTATVSPSNATYKNVTWSSNNEVVATVNNSGKVTAVSGGTAKITASTYNGAFKAECTVNVTGPVLTVLLDLADVLQTKTPQVLDTDEKFYNVFPWLPLGPGGSVSDSDIKYEIINDGGVKKLKFTVYALWGPGLDINAGGSDINFRASDKIEVKGTIQNIRTTGIVLNTIGKATVKPNDNYWEPLQNWGYWTDGEFQNTFTLSDYDASTINDNTSVRIRPDGVSPWSGRDSDGIAIIILEQVKVTGYR